MIQKNIHKYIYDKKKTMKKFFATQDHLTFISIKMYK